MRRSMLALSCLAAGLMITTAFGDAGKTQYGTWGVDLAAMDKTLKPGNDYFGYVNGGWLKTAVIPDDRSSTGSFQDLRVLSESRMLEIAASLDARPYDQLSGEEKKLRDLYDAYNDRAAIDAKGLSPAQGDLDRIAHAKTPGDIAGLMGDPRLGLAAPFYVYIGIDQKHPDAFAIRLFQSGLALPDRDYYLKDDPDLAKTRDAYKQHMAAVFAALGEKDGDARAAAVFELERKMADAEWTNAESREEEATFNPMTYAELKTLTPGFEWDALFKEARLPTASGGRIIVAQKSAFPKLAAIFASTPVAVWRDYLTLNYMHNYAGVLPTKFDELDFDFYGKVLTGNPQQLKRSARAAHLLDNVMGEPLGKIYVAKYFPPAAKAKAEELVSNLLKAYDADIQTLDWMTPKTRERALKKMHNFTVKIGYPDKWRDYSGLAIKRDDLLGSLKNAQEFEWNFNIAKLGHPADKAEWGMTPPTVNAYDNPQWNEIVFPAAILQPPFFDPNADDAVNYGGIGAVIGHEISHSFDDQGSKYDWDGTLNNWWDPADRAAFEARTKALGEQYATYEPLPGLHINAANTMGENIADNAGIAIALKAYHISLGGKDAGILDGYTGDQRFFLSYGQIWRSKMREAALRSITISNEHSPAMFRPIGAARNQDAWYAAFDVKPGETYYLPPDKRVHLW